MAACISNSTAAYRSKPGRYRSASSFASSTTARARRSGLLRFTAPRPVPAVTGAFMSVDRGWFEKLGGFTEDYVFGHYEDADLCLKSIQAGAVPWIHDIRLWHLEGQGSHPPAGA